MREPLLPPAEVEQALEEAEPYRCGLPVVAALIWGGLGLLLLGAAIAAVAVLHG